MPPPDNSTLIKQAEKRTEEANFRTDLANTRTEEANARTKQADLRTEKAETQTEALRSSECSYRRLFEAARDGILILDTDTGRITDVNPFLVELLGFSREDILGKTVGELSPFKDILSNQAMLERLQKDGYVRYDDLPLETRDGRRIPVEFVSNIYQAGDKNVIQCNIRDITVRKRTEMALLEAPPDKVAWRKSSAVKDLTLVCLASALVFVLTWYFNLSNMVLHWMQGRPETLIDESFTALNLLLLGFVWFGFRRWREVQCQGAGRQRVMIALEELRADLETQVRQRTADLARTNENLRAEITERKRAEESLRLLASAVEQSKESIMITEAVLDFPGPKIVFVNPAYTHMTGYTAEEVIGKTPRMMQGPRTDKTVLRRLRHNLAHGESFGGETINYRKDRTEFDLEWQIAPIRDTGGKITHFVATQHDITKHKRVENALRASEERMHLATEATAVGVWEWNVLTNQIRWDAQMFRIYGITPTKDGLVEYGTWSSSVLPEDLHEQEKLLQDMVGHRGHRSREFRIRRPGEREYRHIKSVETARTNAQGLAEWIVGTNLDITERKRTQDELISKTALLEAQVDSTLDGILVVNEQHKVILNNQRLFQLLKIPDDIARDDDDNKMIQYVTSQMKDPKKFTDGVNYLYAHPEEIGHEEIELANGRILDRYSAPVRDKTGKNYGRIWTFRDITDQRKMEAQFRQSQKMEAFGQLAGGVAHDFNNILAVIGLQAELLKSEATLTPEQLEFAGDIQKATQRAADLTRQLLLFSRKQILQPRDVNLKELVDNMARMLQRTLGEQFELKFKFAKETLIIHADPGMMDQILLNLTVNARDAMPDGGKIIIETSAVEFDEVTATQSTHSRPGLFVCLSVSDNGCGIPPEILPQIFEPFFTTKEVGEGTGLGLATVFGIVQQHNGWINVYSEVNRGTTFRVYLPRQTKTSDIEFNLSSAATIRGGPETILLVEDELPVRASMRIALSRLGYCVLEAATGATALAVWKQHLGEISLLLTDLVMPGGMNGKALAEQLLQQNPKLKVIYTSGYSVAVAGKNLPLEDGVNFLAKPFQTDKLAQTIRKRLDQN